MIKLAVLFQENETKNMDLSAPEKGNPGVGGTAFCFLLFLKYIGKKAHGHELDITVYQLQNNILPHDKCVKVDSLEEALNKATEDGNEIVLLRNHQTDEDYDLLQKYDFKYIFWMHNKLTYDEIKLFRTWDNCKRVIAVGRQMYDYYVDDLVIKKLDYIKNPLVPPKENMIREETYEPWVTYVGSLTFDKNFHLITKVWKDILKEVPDAQLHVIGSGRLYDKNSKLGKYGHADEEYERLFMPHILDDEGKPLESVVFHGIMGEEKYEIFKKSAVGIINPMATETFGLAAIEMEACGVPIVCRRKNGLLDSVKDGKTGILYKDISKLAPSIIKLLTNKRLNKKMGTAARDFARHDFRPEGLMPAWQEVIYQVHKNKKASYKAPHRDLDNNGKMLRKFIHTLHRIPALKKIPSIHDIQKK